MMETLEDAYAEGRKDEREAIVAMMLDMYADDYSAQWSAWHFAQIIKDMDIKPKDTDAKP